VGLYEYSLNPAICKDCLEKALDLLNGKKRKKGTKDEH
jgi:hypothetical protein